MNRKNKNIVSYVEYSIQLHSCIERNRVLTLQDEIEQFIRDKLETLDFESDVKVYLENRTK